MGIEVLYLVIAIAAIAGVIFFLRRASQKSRANTGRAVQERLREAGGDDDDRGRRGPSGRAGATAGRQEAVASKQSAKPAAATAKATARKAAVAKATAAKTTARKRKRDRDDEDDDDDDDDDDDLDETGAAAERDAVASDDDRATGAALKSGLAKTRGGFVARLGKLFEKKKFDDAVLAEIEEVLFSADIGPRTAGKLLDAIKAQLSKDQLTDPATIWSKIREASATILAVDDRPVDLAAHKPFVLLTIGVNGVGKTTTIGKIAAKLTGEGKRVLLAAGDTFRAAATEQLEIWAQRAGADIVKGKPGGDPSSVIYDAIRRGIAEDYDVVICDTAGRLQTKVELMDELKKVGRVCEKALPGAPHQTWLVLDATTGQNAIQQAQVFKDAMHITGIVLTKLDGTAKGGVILGISDELKVPVRYIGIGERVEDLRVFDPRAFVAALYEDAATAEAA